MVVLTLLIRTAPLVQTAVPASLRVKPLYMFAYIDTCTFPPPIYNCAIHTVRLTDQV